LGIVSIDTNTGIITYIAGSVAGNHTLQYRVRDINGSPSGRGKISITVTGLTPLGAINFSVPN
jgi:hypothetical protein